MEKGHVIDVLDHGYVKYVDSMGTDENVIEAARMSTGRGFEGWEKDAGLLDFLWRKKHSTPFEMVELALEIQAPIMVFREWQRHRTQCLAGDTKLHFDLPGGIERRGTQKYSMTIKEVFEKFQPTVRKNRPERQTNALFPRQRIQAMRLRCLNEETKEVTHTSIVDVWESGTKVVYDVEVEGVGKIRCSKDHRFFTTDGWKRLEELADLEQVYLQHYAIYLGKEVYTVYGAPNESKSFEVPANEVEEQWKPVTGLEDYYEVSDMGRVRRIARGQGVRTQGTTKTLSPDMAGYLCTTLNRPGEQVRPHIHRLVLEAFVGACPDGMECRHLDGNQMNNWLSNLKWGTPQENAEDRVRQGRVPSLKAWTKKITSITFAGEEMTYDIEVAGPWHNFVAEGFVVHNSYNEFSARYSQMPNLHYLPDPSRLKKQSSTNKQGTGDEEFPQEYIDMTLEELEYEQKQTYSHYEQMLTEGVAKEIARLNTPVSRYSKMRAKANLKNWLGFLNLRLRPNAQFEIRVFAEPVADIIRKLFPRSYDLFEEYDLYGVSFSRTEMAAIRDVIKTMQMSQRDLMEPFVTSAKKHNIDGRKLQEFIEKLEKGGLEILS